MESIGDSKLFLLAALCVFIPAGIAYLDIDKYCHAFDSNFRPIICILKNQTGGSNNGPPVRPPRPSEEPFYPILYPDSEPDYTDSDEDDDCSCDLKCYPRIVRANDTMVRYRCRSCGTKCWVKTTRTPSCSCAVPSGNATCNCRATCAMFRMSSTEYEEDSSHEDSNCIFNIGNLTEPALMDEQRPFSCECCKSKAAENNSDPDFVCICQRVSTSSPGR